MEIENSVALVTGATRGIGKAIATSLASQGAIVIGTATSEQGAKNISSYLEEIQNKGAGRVLNVTNSDSIDELIKEIAATYSTPTILVNNAGITRDNLLMRMKDDEWDDIINTNLTSVFRLSKACLRGMMKAKQGRIISIASVVGASGNAGQSNYAAAKAGIVGFSKSLAREVASRGITVNVVAPGFIDTDMTKDLPEAHKTELLKSIPLNRLGDPADIAEAVSYLASSRASYVTGQTLHINGGMYMN